MELLGPNKAFFIAFHFQFSKWNYLLKEQKVISLKLLSPETNLSLSLSFV